MRTMHSVDFCDACIEGLWLSLLRPLSLIDTVTQKAQSDGSTNVTVDLLPLAQFRDVPRETESYTIFWYGADGETVLEQWTNQTSAIIEEGAGSFEIDVTFQTTQVRVDSDGLLTLRERFDVE
jgi:hypothetical protein